jgi:hypothetical protein
MKVKAKWTGKMPLLGDYLMSSLRPRFAYRIEGFEAAVKQFGANPDDQFALTITVTKVSLHGVPEDATIHSWKWDSRGPKKVMEARHG